MTELHIAQPAKCRRYRMLGDVYTILTPGDRVDDRYCWVEAAVGPGNGPPMHLHRREDEAFFMLEGSLTFTVDGREITASAGDALSVPAGVGHTFRNDTDRLARYLVQTTPAAFDRMVMACGSPVDSDAAPRPPTEDEIAGVVARLDEFGIDLVQ